MKREQIERGDCYEKRGLAGKRGKTGKRGAGKRGTARKSETVVKR